MLHFKLSSCNKFLIYRSAMSTEQSNSDSVVGKSTCPYCEKNGFKRLGTHLPYCSQRNGRDYTSFLSTKTLAKKASADSCKTKFCPRCHKRFSRIDTHQRNSSTCRVIPQKDDSPAPTATLVQLPCQQDSEFSTMETGLYQQEFRPRLCLPTSTEG